MELTDLRHFFHVASTGSFTAGARRSHVSPPAVSKAIRKLEDELGLPLFLRTTRRVALTRAGEALVGRCERIFAELASLQADLEAFESRIAGDLRIAANEVLSIELLPRAIADLLREHPDVRPLTYEMLPAEMERRIRDGQVEVGFTIGGHSDPAIHYEVMGESDGVLVCGRTHPLYGHKRIRRKDLEAHPFVVPSFFDTEGAPSLDQFPDMKLPRHVGATIELLQMGVQLAIEGAFLAYFPKISIRSHLADGSLCAISGVGGAPFTLRALTRKNQSRRPAVQKIIDRVRAQITETIHGNHPRSA